MERNELRKIAEDTVVKKEQVSVKPGELTVECDQGKFTYDKDGNPQKFITQTAVRRFHADITVRLDADTGKLISWLIPARYDGAIRTMITEDEAMQIAGSIIEIPKDAELEEMTQEKEPDSHITNIFWRHVIKDVEVEGDSIALQINSTTKQVISLTRIWNIFKDYDCRISGKDAESIAQRKAPEYVEMNQYEIETVEQRYIPIVDGSGDERKVRFVKVWRINIIEELGRFPRITTLNIDCLTGDVVRIEHSK
jgi:hypothetical protein